MASKAKANKANKAAPEAAPEAAPAKNDADDAILTDKGDKNRSLLWLIPQLAAVGFACYLAFTIRLYAINEYGLVIHEFDPW